MSPPTRRVLPDLPESGVEIEAVEPDGDLITVCFDQPGCSHRFPLGKLIDFERAVACRRSSPFWMVPCAGGPRFSVPEETQWLLLRLSCDRFVILVPLIDDLFRCSLAGGPDGRIELVLETGDTGTAGNQAAGLYIADGSDPYQLMETGAEAVSRHLRRGRLRCEKPLPPFVDEFGWCTWNSFYAEVSHSKLREGFESFRSGGVEPRWLLLDGGWQSTRKMPTGENQLTAFEANEKFPDGLRATVKMAKKEYAITTFLVWHAMHGMVGGIAPEAFSAFRSHRMQRRLPRVFQRNSPWVFDNWGRCVSQLAPEDASRFFQEYHRFLHRAGVDGVKVDFQAQLELLAEGFGGRIRLVEQYRNALEGSAAAHFGGALINCMSLSNEMLYQASASTLTRTSDDFYPNKPKSHGLHLTSNAWTSMWFGEFIHPDWDMFQSHHPQGAFHAAARAVSGGPVCVADEIGKQDFSILRKLVMANGHIPRPLGIARPTRDVLFHDPVKEDVALKVFNLNATGGVLGIFNCQFNEETGETPEVEASFSPADIEGIQGTEFIVRTHCDQRIHRIGLHDRITVQLGGYGHEVATVAPVVDGVAILGDPDLFNSGGTIAEAARIGSRWRLRMKGPGQLMVFSLAHPLPVEGLKLIDFQHESGIALLRVTAEGWVEFGVSD